MRGDTLPFHSVRYDVAALFPSSQTIRSSPTPDPGTLDMRWLARGKLGGRHGHDSPCPPVIPFLGSFSRDNRDGLLLCSSQETWFFAKRILPSPA